MADTFAALAAEQFVSLTTFRRSGEPVATPLWIVADGDALVVWTPADTGKVKRVRRDPRVTLAPCGRLGKVAADAVVTEAVAEVVEAAAAVSNVESALRRKYRLSFPVVTLIERLLRGRKRRVLLRITPAR